LAPAGVLKTQQLFNQQAAMTEFDTLAAGRFQSLGSGQRVTYAGGLSEDRTQLEDLFITERAGGIDDTTVGVLVAETGRQQMNVDGSRYLVLYDGYRYDGTPGSADFRVITYGVLLPKPEIATEVTDREGIPTLQLFGHSDVDLRAELQWRLALPLLVFIVAFFAVPLSRVNPRQGRFLKLLPAVMLYMAYLALLISARGWMESGALPAVLGLWWVHVLFLIIGVVLNRQALLPQPVPREIAHAHS
jgi:lipopolysaccharide export system permease protein